MTIVTASNIKITCNQAGADGIFDGPGDDVYMQWGTGSGGGEGFFRKVNRLPGTDLDALGGMFATETAKLSGTSTLIGDNFDPDLPLFGIGGESRISFSLRDRDNTLFDKTDDLLLQTTYVATGKEPLVGAGSLYFVKTSEENGSKYKLEYNINKFSFTGKVATNKGGVMDGRNTDGTMVGLGGKDTINGNNGDDLILGGGNSDSMNGGKGDDVIFSGAGKDRSTGGSGKDTFIVARNSGFDTIQDFRVGQDHIGLADDLTFQDLSFSRWGRGTLVKAGNEKVAWLDGVNPNQLSASSFVQSDLAGINSLVSANLATIRNS